MALRRTAFAHKEWYHCYSRGIEGRKTFETKRDYERFIQCLYLCNSHESVRQDNLRNKVKQDIFLIPRSNQLVTIGAYCLMPNHFHLLLQEKSKNGIPRFMQKLGTAYTMYFNIKNERVGGLFITPFRSKHVPGDRYFKHVVQYIHLNPIDLFEPKWKNSPLIARRRLATIEQMLKAYPYSSLADYVGSKRVERVILDQEAVDLLRTDLPPLSQVIKEAAMYYQELPR